MSFAVINSKVVTDNTGAFYDLPVLFSEAGAVIPLLRYQLLYSANSYSWHRKLLFAVMLLLEYASANIGNFDKVEALFHSFADRIRGGTLSPESLDPSGLYWTPRRAKNGRTIIRQLSEFSNWHSKQIDGRPLNPLREGSRAEEVLGFAAWCRRNNESFLGHLSSKILAAVQSHFTPNVGFKAMPTVIRHAKAFPEYKFNELILNGFVQTGRRHEVPGIERLNLRDALITLMQHGTGVRNSECFHLWVTDVMENPLKPGVALIRVHHPILGEFEWKDAQGRYVKGTREDYLRTKGLQPRNLLIDTGRAGWKNPTLDCEYYMNLHWFPETYGMLFMRLWRRYLGKIRSLARNHPYAWVTFDGPQPGSIYRLRHYENAHRRAVERIGLVADQRRGTTPHSHRHAYGQRLALFGVREHVIQRCMHHGSIHSQEVYTEAQEREVNEVLTAAHKHLNSENNVKHAIELGAALLAE
jgi:hypothetical protein